MRFRRFLTYRFFPGLLSPILFSAATLLLSPIAALTAEAQAYEAKPRLVVVVVIDQFRGDLLSRYRSEFKGRGFRLFLDEGAWFPDCYYNYVNTKTGPGHATLGTGAYTDAHGIQSNEWWDADRSTKHTVSSVEDERYSLVDMPPGTKDLTGASPRNEHASTLGDELRLATSGRSRVFGVSIKDRAAILPSGHAANGAFWLDDASGRFTSSTYYMEHLPAWAQAFNSSGRLTAARQEAGAAPGRYSTTIEMGPASDHYELDFAQALITAEKLGQGPTTDLLTVSLSAHDNIGHRFGPDSEQEHAMVLGLDANLDRFFTWLDQTVGLKNVWVALSADHGVAPVPARAAALGIDSGTVDMKLLLEKINEAMKAKLAPGKPRYSDPPWPNLVLPSADLPYITLDKRVFESMGIDEKKAEDTLASVLPSVVAELAPVTPATPAMHKLPPAPFVMGAYTRLQIAHGDLPHTEMGQAIAHSYAYHGNWFVLMLLGPYQMNDQHSSGTTHFSPWSYDRHVPLAFYGSAFAPGTYRGRVEPVDMAATFASLLGINQPS
ncbi:MAG TPA: alkaline phosphatase family protein, partial [Acidobacteriaceae bacterium]|nr:alkaline phosphatase family protein [Acidobacteriaceae bacterium]